MDSVYALTPEQQYYSLNDLTCFKYNSKYTYPDEDVCVSLREELHSYISKTPIGLSFSKIRETAFRKDWMTAYSRINTNPAAAVTAARTLLETIFKTIISERGRKPDKSGKLNRLMQEAQDAVGFIRAQSQSEHELIQGLVGIINAVGSISNEAGDRHGTVDGINLDDQYLAYLCVNACGTVGLCFIKNIYLSQLETLLIEIFSVLYIKTF